MKLFFFYLILAITAVVMGTAVGLGYCRHQYADVKEPFYAGQWDQSVRDRMRPILVVDGGLEHDFGAVQAGKTYRHEFIFENRGDLPLEIKLAETSDNVAIDLGDKQLSIEPSASLPVEVSLSIAEGKDKSGFALISTNDLASGHDRVRLIVSGN